MRTTVHVLTCISEIMRHLVGKVPDPAINVVEIHCPINALPEIVVSDGYPLTKTLPVPVVLSPFRYSTT